LARALGGLGEVKGVALGEQVGVGRVVEVPHERRGVEEVDCGYAERHSFSLPAVLPDGPAARRALTA
jgi:hypothetical protein